MDDQDRHLLILLQDDFPVTHSPLEAWAKRLKTDVADVLLKIHRLQEMGIVQKIAGVFEGRLLGYQSALVAMSFQEEDLDRGIQVLQTHPGVHGLSWREYYFNLWFSLALPHSESFEQHVRRLEGVSGALRSLLLPNLKTFKIDGVSYVAKGQRLSQKEQTQEKPLKRKNPRFTFTEIDLIRILQDGVPLTDHPFEKIAQQLGDSEEEVFQKIRSFREQGCLLRLATVFQPIAATKKESELLALWQIPEEKMEYAVRQIGMFPEIKQCHMRRAYEKFPYNLYITLRASCFSQCHERVLEISKKIGSWPFLRIPTLREYKKSEPKYFSFHLKEWWNHAKELHEVS